MFDVLKKVTEIVTKSAEKEKKPKPTNPRSMFLKEKQGKK